MSSELSSVGPVAQTNRRKRRLGFWCVFQAAEILGDARYRGWVFSGMMVAVLAISGCGKKNDSIQPATPNQNVDAKETVPSSGGKSKLSEDDQQRYREAADAIKSGDLFRAEKTLTELADQYPSNATVLSEAARTASRRGNRYLGNRHLRDMARIAPLTLKELYGLLSPSRDYPLIASEELDDSAPRSASVINEARRMRLTGDLRSAINILQEYQSDHPDAAAAALLGRYLVESQQWDRAADWLHGRSDDSSKYPDFWVAIGAIGQTAGQNELAVDAFSKAVSLEPYDQSALMQLSAALESAGQKEHAEFYRDRWDVVKNLVELSGDIAVSPKSQPFAYSVMERELNKIGQPIDGFNWILLKRQNNANTRSRIKDRPSDRAKAVEDYDTNENAEKRLHFINGANPVFDVADLADSISGLKRVESNSSAPSEKKIISPVFRDIAGEVGLSFQYANAVPVKQKFFLLHEALGAGVACLDFDRDGLVDVYFAQGAGNPPEQLGAEPNTLFRNSDLNFLDVTAKAECDDRGYSMAVTSGDWNQDGFPDLLVGNMAENRLLINQGDGTYRLQDGDDLWRTAKYTSALAIADVSGDAITDIVEVNYTDDETIFDPIRFSPDGEPVRLPGPLQFQAASDRVFYGTGDGSMKGAHLTENSTRRYGLGVVVSDFDQDGQNEIFVGNDQTPNQFWKLTESGEKNESIRFDDVAVVSGVSGGSGGLPTASMGIAVADFDGNGLVDFHITNFRDEWSNHYLQKKPGWFLDQSLPWGLDQSTGEMLAFGAQAIDYDNDRIVDLVIGNGHLEDFSERKIPFKMPTQLFSNNGSSLRETSVTGDDDYWQSGHLSRALATMDFDADGRMDFVVTDLLAPVALLHNETTTSHHFLQIELVGTACERTAIGAKVTVKGEGWQSTAVVTAGDGYMCKNESVLHFGLGQSRDVQSIDVTWPGGKQETLRNIDGDQRIVIVEGLTHQPSS